MGHWQEFFFFKQKTAYEMRISDWSSECALPISHLAPRIGDAEDERPGARGDRFGKSHARKAERQFAIVVAKFADAIVGPENREAARGLYGDFVVHMAKIEEVGAGDRKSTRLNSSH